MDEFANKNFICKLQLFCEERRSQMLALSKEDKFKNYDKH